MIRKAKIKEAAKLQEMINFYAAKNMMLPRSLNEIYENIRDFFVYEKDGKIVGCCALHVCWQDLAEVKSLAVAPKYKSKGVGKELVEKALDEAKALGVKRVFALTYVPAFFRKCGFKPISKSKLPQKIWGECINCVKFPNCDENPMICEIGNR